MSVPASISVASAAQKSKLAAEYPWIILVRITWPDGNVLRLARYPDDVTFDSGDGAGPQAYTAFAWEMGELQENSDGSIPQWAVKVSNVSRAVEALLEEYGGGVGGTVAVYVVNGQKLYREPALELDFDIVGSGSDADFVNFKLGAESPFRIIFGRHPYASDSCHWQYKSPECGYTGDMPTCTFRLNGANGCRAHENASRIGCYPGIDSNGYQAVPK